MLRYPGEKSVYQVKGSSATYCDSASTFPCDSRGYRVSGFFWMFFLKGKSAIIFFKGNGGNITMPD